MLRTEDGSIRGTVKMIETAKLQNLKNQDHSKQGEGHFMLCICSLCSVVNHVVLVLFPPRNRSSQ